MTHCAKQCWLQDSFLFHPAIELAWELKSSRMQGTISYEKISQFMELLKIINWSTKGFAFVNYFFFLRGFWLSLISSPNEIYHRNCSHFSVHCRLTKTCWLTHCFALVLIFFHSVEGWDLLFPPKEGFCISWDEMFSWKYSNMRLLSDMSLHVLRAW